MASRVVTADSDIGLCYHKKEGKTRMMIVIGSELERVLNDLADKEGVTAEMVAIKALRERFLPPVVQMQAKDEWEKRLLEIGTDCGVSLSHKAVSSEGLYE